MKHDMQKKVQSVVVIGSGAAGTSAARTLASSGFDVTVVERGKVGGACLWSACMPKKALYVAARARRERVRSEQFGLGVCDTTFDWSTVLAWKWHTQETYAGDQERGFRESGIKLLKGTARFASPDTIEVEGHKLLHPDHIVIATGSRPVLPPLEGIGLSDTSDDAIGYHDLPESLLIIGGGYVAMEFAAIYASFGTAVTIATKGTRLLEAFDEETVGIARLHLARLGVVIHTGCNMIALSGQRGNVRTQYTDDHGTTHSERYERVLVAAGRVPATADLDLDSGYIQTDRDGRIKADTFLRTANPKVWVAGDVVGGMMQTPVAVYQGMTVATSIASGVPVATDHSAIPTTVFTSPQLAQVGLTEHAARQAGIEFRVGRMPFEYLGAAVADDTRDGLVKLLFAAEDDRLIGAHIAGPNAAELIFAMALAMKHGATAATLRDTIGIHPAYNEALVWAAF